MAAGTVAEELACYHRRAKSITGWILRSIDSPAKLDKQVEVVRSSSDS